VVSNTWTYDPATLRLASVTLPEIGATSFVYNSQGLVLSKTDAKLQRIEYLRDSFNRVTEVRRFNSFGMEQGAQWRGANFVTTYAYNFFNQMVTATMTRGAVTQTRTSYY
jgi:YD repeat-containing protein